MQKKDNDCPMCELFGTPNTSIVNIKINNEWVQTTLTKTTMDALSNTFNKTLDELE